MTYEEALDYLLAFTDLERGSPAGDFDLGRVRELLTRLGEPQQGVPTVHVAGTKGKGSTCAMVASALEAAGYRTGLYTSPHLHSLQERIQVSGQPISREELARAVARLKPVVDGMESREHLTTFEVLTALALGYFREQAVEVQVLEVGLGGRLDATNVVDPLVAVITSLSLDHTALLGDSLEQIAWEKGGIIKPGVTVVSAPQRPEALGVLEGLCRERGARLVLVGREVTWQGGAWSLQGQGLGVQGQRESYQLLIPLLGVHQQENAAVAVAALEVLMPGFPRLTPQAIARGLARVFWPGRFQVLRERPPVVVDGAHNRDSARRLRETVQAYFPGRRVVLVFGTSGDKDIPGMAQELVPLASRVILTASRHPRAAPAAALEGFFQAVPYEVATSVPEAMEKALALAGGEGMVLVTGSLFVVAEVIEWITYPLSKEVPWLR